MQEGCSDLWFCIGPFCTVVASGRQCICRNAMPTFHINTRDDQYVEDMRWQGGSMYWG